MSEVPRQLHLNAFLRNVGQHEAAWRRPETNLSGFTDIDHYIHLAQTAERGLLDAIFFADHPVLKSRSQDRLFDTLDPLTLLAALSTATQRIGLVATASTTYNEPYNLARRYATLDHVSRGRAAWNIVTTANANAAANFGYPHHPDADQRYARASEFLDVVLKLWDSWDEDAFIGDKEGGLLVEPDRIHEINHKGEHFSVRGPLEVPRSPQGRPVLFEAGSSEPGKNLSAQYADAIFTAQPDYENAQAFYRDVKSRVKGYGRNPDHVLILPGLSFFIGGTEEQARALQNEFEDLTLPTYGLAQLNQTAGLSLTLDDLDSVFTLPGAEEKSIAMKSRVELLRHIASTETITLRQLLRRLSAGRGHRVVAGTPEQIADTIEHWFKNGAADGFNLIPPALPTSLAAFVDHVVPELQKRRLFRTEYTGTTLREHLGLTAPARVREPSASVADAAATA